MSETPQSGNPESLAPGLGRAFAAGLPWERITMWAALGLLLYVMRDFFFVIFMTFLLCYCVRRVVNMALAWFPRGWRTLWVDRGITITVFIAMLTVLASLLGTLIPKIVEQSRIVFFKIEHAEWQVEFDRLLRQTVGDYLWGRSFSQPSGATRKIVNAGVTSIRSKTCAFSSTDIRQVPYLLPSEIVHSEHTKRVGRCGRFERFHDLLNPIAGYSYVPHAFRPSDWCFPAQLMPIPPLSSSASSPASRREFLRGLCARFAGLLSYDSHR